MLAKGRWDLTWRLNGLYMCVCVCVCVCVGAFLVQTKYIQHVLSTSQYSEQAMDWTVWGSNPSRSTKFFSSKPAVRPTQLLGTGVLSCA